MFSSICMNDNDSSLERLKKGWGQGVCQGIVGAGNAVGEEEGESY